MVFTRSLSDSTFDEMILLLHSRAPKYQGWISRYVRPVTYENIREIPNRLRMKAAGRADTHADLPQAPGLPNPGGHSVQPENDDGQQKQSTLPKEDVLSQNGAAPPVDNSSHDEVPVSREEIEAVLVLETAYLRVSTRRKEALKGIDATRARLWSLIHERVSSMEWSRHTRYKLLMQGPLVHVLVCLDCVKMFADYINKDSKKQLRGSDHKRLEELIEKSDRSRYLNTCSRFSAALFNCFIVSDLQRATVELQTKLGHSSPFHNDRNVLALKAAVLEVERLIGRLSEFPGNASTKTKDRIKEDWQLGWDGIVKESFKGRKVQKPKLNLDEEDLLYS